MGPSKKLVGIGLFVIMLIGTCAGCAAGVASARLMPPKRSIGVYFADDLKFDQDQILVCTFLKERDFIKCISYEEFLIRMEAEDEGGGR